MNSKYAVQVKNVKKSFHLPNHKNDSIKSSITQVFKPKDKGVNTFNALNDISFNVEKGDFFGILGRNGSGKSTLLKIIAEIYQPSAGNVSHDGKIVSFIELGVGFRSELSGRENVFLNGAMLGFSKKEMESMYDEIVDFAELEMFMDQKLKNYSSGMKVRLAFSVAIRAKADILILDEVLAVGDADFQRKCNDYFATLKDDKKTVILVTHSMGNVRKFCNKAIVIEDGKILFEGGAEEAAESYLDLFGKRDRKIKQSDMTGRVKIHDLLVSSDKDQITVTANLVAEVSIENVKYGLAIKNPTGKTVSGINTIRSDGGRVLKFKAGEKKTIKFSSLNILGNDKHSVIATAVTLDGEILDRRVAKKDIYNELDEVTYPTVLPTKVVIEED